jgi:hypothetical protein
MLEVRKEPKVRKDGKCVVCRKERRMPKTHHSSISMAVYELDPFCSSTCCRAWYGAPVPSFAS